MNSGKLPYILIALLACMLVAAFWFGYQRSQHLQQQNQNVEQRLEDWTKIIDLLTEQQREILASVTKKEVEKKEIRMDVGREIKEFNRTIKRIKQIEDPYESISSLDRAWATD